MDILRAKEEVGSVVSSNWIDSLVFDHTATTFKKLLHIVKVRIIKILLLELMSNDKRRILVRALHCEGKLGGSSPVLKGIKDFLERINKFTLSTVGSTVAHNSSPLPKVLFCNKESSKLLKHLSIWITISLRVWHSSLVILIPL